jgi:TM2 domain-containing membrane protein YozV
MQYENRITTPQPEAAPRTPPNEPLARRRDLPYKVPFLAGFLSGFFPGVGQLYVGYYRQGITLAILFAGIITILASNGLTGLEPFLGITLGFCWLYGIIDATRRAQAVNRALDGFGQEPLPEDFALPGGGSVFGGSVLVILGVVLLLHTRFGMSLDWVADWWPLFLVAVGAWLIRQARREKVEKTGRQTLERPD